MQTKLASLTERITANAMVQEGDQPQEDPLALIRQADDLLADRQALVERINTANQQARVDEQRTVAQAIAQRDRLTKMHSILHAALEAARGNGGGTANHLLINALVLEAFQQIIPGVAGDLVYFISHNIARQEVVPHSHKLEWVHRKGATRAFPAGHHALKGTPFAATGHPILLPGNPQAGSSVMVANEGAAMSNYSVNHGAGRTMGRRHALRTLDQKLIDESFAACDILTNCRQYPRDEAPAAYKDFNEVLRSVELAGLASEVARLKARFVIKDAAKADD
ncbi:MAG: DIP1984 family protein [Phycisphaeraceae bacterium]